MRRKSWIPSDGPPNRKDTGGVLRPIHAVNHTRQPKTPLQRPIDAQGAALAITSTLHYRPHAAALAPPRCSLRAAPSTIRAWDLHASRPTNKCIALILVH